MHNGLYIGLMSGTSMDGIDVALVDVNHNQLILGKTVAYPHTTTTLLQTVLKEQSPSIETLYRLNQNIGQAFADAAGLVLEEAGVSSKAVVAIGSHGQTIAHDAFAGVPYTVQLGCPHTIAEQTGITVVADFRTRDMVAGGLGAPFAPVYHQVLFGDFKEPLAIVNIGGIANISFLTQGMHPHGYDIGPGNVLMDLWSEKQLQSSYDKDGAWASKGKLIKPLLDALLDDPYFKRLPPKSIGKEYFSDLWLSKFLTTDYLKEDVQATLLALTVTTIQKSVSNYGIPLKRLMLSGGGAHNAALLAQLQQCMPELSIKTTQAMGVDPDFIEAMMFAWFAKQTLNRIPVDLTRITGADKPTILGAVYSVI